MKKFANKYYLSGLIAMATSLVYLNSLKNGFINLDDLNYIYENPNIRSLDLSFLKWAFFHFYQANWHPLTWISHALDYALWGLNATGHHLTNIVLHSANAFIVVLLAARLIETWEVGRARCDRQASFSQRTKLIAAGTAGLLFGIHPVHVEAVAWAAERKEILCAFFFLLSILTYLKYVESKGGRTEGPVHRPGRMYFLSLCFFTLALMSKPMAVSLPLVLLILDWHPLGRLQSLKASWKVLAEKLPFVFLSGASSVLTIMAQNAGGAIRTSQFAPFPIRMLIAAKSLTAYLWKMALPLELVPFYPYPKNVSLFAFKYFLPVIFVIVVTAFCLLAAKRQKAWLASWSYYVLTMLPVLGIIQVGDQSMADRYTYLPSLGPFLIAGLAAAWVWKRTDALKELRRTIKTVSASAAVIAVLSISCLTVRQIGIWKNSIVFWDYIIKKEPEAAWPHNELGKIFYGENLPEQAIKEFRAAIKAEPNYMRANVTLSAIYDKLGQTYEAEKILRAALMRTSNDEDLSVLHNNLGQLYIKNGNYKEAISELETAVHLQPGWADVHYNLGCVYMQLVQLNLAAREFEETLKLDPANLLAKKDLELIKSLTGNPSGGLHN